MKRPRLTSIPLGICLVVASTGKAQSPALAEQYGFLPPEIYKLGNRIENLVIHDVNSDGKNDIVIVNGEQNRIDILFQRGKDDPEVVQVYEKIATGTITVVCVSRDEHGVMKARPFPPDIASLFEVSAEAEAGARAGA